MEQTNLVTSHAVILQDGGAQKVELKWLKFTLY